MYLIVPDSPQIVNSWQRFLRVELKFDKCGEFVKNLLSVWRTVRGYGIMESKPEA